MPRLAKRGTDERRRQPQQADLLGGVRIVLDGLCDPAHRGGVELAVDECDQRAIIQVRHPDTILTTFSVAPSASALMPRPRIRVSLARAKRLITVPIGIAAA